MTKVFLRPKELINCPNKCEVSGSANNMINISDIYKDMSHNRKQNKSKHEDIVSWKIIFNQDERKYIQAVEIQKHSENIRNGCIERSVNI